MDITILNQIIKLQNQLAPVNSYGHTSNRVLVTDSHLFRHTLSINEQGDSNLNSDDVGFRRIIICAESSIINLDVEKQLSQSHKICEVVSEKLCDYWTNHFTGIIANC